MSPTPSALIVDDHPLVGQSVAALLRAIAPSIGVYTRETLRSCAALSTRCPSVGLVVADLTLPDASGLQALHQLRIWWPAARIVVFSGVRNALLERHALEAGAQAFVLKTAAPRALQAALQAALSQTPPPAGGSATGSTAGMDGTDMHPFGLAFDLTPRQREVWRDLADGLSNAEIGERLGVSLNTVKTHVRELFERIGARNRTEAARLFVRQRVDDGLAGG